MYQYQYGINNIGIGSSTDVNIDTSSAIGTGTDIGTCTDVSGGIGVQ